MSDGPIKPEDVPNSAVELANSLRNYHRGSTLDAEALASVLNSAIELGIVSPPCRVLRSKFGTLYPEMLYPSDYEAQSNASPGDSSEHWRGQRE